MTVEGKSEVKRIHLTLGPHLQPLRECCERQGVGIQHLLRQLVADYLKRQVQTEDLIDGIPFGAKTARPSRIELRLLPEEMAALRKFALKENIAPSNWLIQRLQDAMMVEEGKSIGREELLQFAQMLDQVQRTIVGIAVNLNQVARAVNRRVKPEDRLSASRLLVLGKIEKDLMRIVEPAQRILARVENPREYPLRPSPRKRARKQTT